MITKFECVNINSTNPKALYDFYKTIGAPAFAINGCYDGWRLGNENEGYICVWDAKWGKSTAGFVTIVFRVDDLQKTYEDLSAKGININPPIKTAWGGEKIEFEDLDGNKLLFLQEGK